MAKLIFNMGLNRYEGILSSGEITSSQTITTAGKQGLLYGIILRSGTTASSALLSDGGSAGTIKAAVSQAASTNAGDATVIFTPCEPVDFTTDIYLTIAGTGAKAYILYKQQVA